MGTAAACSNVRLAGLGASASSETDAYSAKAPPSPPAPAEDLVTGLKARHAGADGFDRPRHVGPSDGVLWLAQPVDRAGDVRQAAHDRPVARVDPGGADANQHLLFCDLGLVDVPEFQDIGRAVLALNDGHHGVLVNRAAFR
jgi:hypothetical protein